MTHYSHVIYPCYPNMSQKTCLPVVNLRQITLLRGYIHLNEQARGIYTRNALSFRCTLMILHLSRMRRNVNRNVYNARKMVALHRCTENVALGWCMMAEGTHGPTYAANRTVSRVGVVSR